VHNFAIPRKCQNLQASRNDRANGCSCYLRGRLNLNKMKVLKQTTLFKSNSTKAWKMLGKERKNSFCPGHLPVPSFLWLCKKCFPLAFSAAFLTSLEILQKHDSQVTIYTYIDRCIRCKCTFKWKNANCFRVVLLDLAPTFILNVAYTHTLSPDAFNVQLYFMNFLSFWHLKLVSSNPLGWKKTDIAYLEVGFMN
jgi:hypothetical protein